VRDDAVTLRDAITADDAMSASGYDEERGALSAIAQKEARAHCHIVYYATIRHYVDTISPSPTLTSLITLSSAITRLIATMPLVAATFRLLYHDYRLTFSMMLEP